MYFDEDGDLAHEFYEEVAPKRKGGKRKMKRIEDIGKRNWGKRNEERGERRAER